jgi:electron transport complex protein RnfB
VTDTATGWDAWSAEQAEVAKKRYQFHSLARLKTKGLKPKLPEEKTENPASSKLSVIQAALARSRQQRGA